MSKHASRRPRGSGRRKKKHHNRPTRSDAARKARKASADRCRQQPVTETELDRIGKYAIEEARTENEKRYQQRLVDASDGTKYYRTPHGQWVKTDGRAIVKPDGTLRTLPPAPRLSKRERAKMKRDLKRKEEAR